MGSCLRERKFSVFSIQKMMLDCLLSAEKMKVSSIMPAIKIVQKIIKMPNCTALRVNTSREMCGLTKDKILIVISRLF